MSIITYPLDGVTYSAEDVATYLCTRTSGVYAKDSNFAVSITGTRQITIAPGLAWINYDDFKGVSVCSREDTVLTVPDADNTLNRVDRVVLQFDTSSNLTTIRLKTGTPAVAAQPPDILQNHNQYELGLCTISVPAAGKSQLLGLIPHHTEHLLRLIDADHIVACLRQHQGQFPGAAAKVGYNAVMDAVGFQLCMDLAVQGVVVRFAVEFIVEIGKFVVSHGVTPLPRFPQPLRR